MELLGIRLYKVWGRESWVLNYFLLKLAFQRDRDGELYRVCHTGSDGQVVPAARYRVHLRTALRRLYLTAVLRL